MYISNDTTGMIQWSSASEYTANTTLYSFDFSNYVGDYRTLMNNIDATEKKLETQVTTGMERNLAWNLILWSTFSDTFWLNCSVKNPLLSKFIKGFNNKTSGNFVALTFIKNIF